jgi:hypothetical protein
MQREEDPELDAELLEALPQIRSGRAVDIGVELHALRHT